MKANELRIGNLVKIMPAKDDILCEIIELKESDVTLFINKKESVLYLPYAAIIPAKISKDIIEKFGFEFHDYDLFDDLSDDFEEGNSKCTMLTYKLKHPRFKRIWIGLDFYEEDEYCQVYSFNPLKKNNDGSLYHDYIESVHQLQNLYFSLTGEELELKQD